MASTPDMVLDYLRSLDEESAELRFLKSIPWVVDAGPQNHSWLVQGLRLEAARLAELPRQVMFSLITPMWNTPPRLLEELILSVRCQSWLRWELLLVDDGSPRKGHIEVARRWADRDPRITLVELTENLGISGARNRAIERCRGDFACILDHDDLIHPAALGIFARHLNQDPDANLIFSNEAKIDESSRRVSSFMTKPPFDLFTLLRANYVCHFTAIHRELIQAARRDGRVFRSEYDGAEDHDLFLRVALTGKVRAIHVPLFLYYWRITATSTARAHEAKPEIPARRARLMEELIPEVYPQSTWAATPSHPGASHVFTSIKLRSLADHPRPSLLAIVPFKDHVDVTLNCLASLEGQQHELDVTVALVDNGSEEVGTRNALDRWLSEERNHRYAVIDVPGAFNFARLNNEAIRRLGGAADLLLFLNNDVELGSPDCLQSLAMHCLAEPNCGFAGIKLLYPDGAEIQHGGVRIAEDLVGAGYFVLHHPRGPEDYVNDEHVVFGVTFACAMTRRAVYEQLGGLDEIMLPNAFGDVDLCARALERGFRNYYFGTLVGTHHESKSRGRAAEEMDLAVLHERHGQTFASWRLRNPNFAEAYAWPRPAPTPPQPPPSTLVSTAPAPPAGVLGDAAPLALRYRVADRVNGILKGVPGPFHRLAKSGLVGGWRMLRTGRTTCVSTFVDSPASAVARSIYRPWLLRGRKARRGTRRD